MNGVGDQRHALLMVQAPHVAEDRLVGLLQPKPLPQRFLVLVFFVPRPNSILARDVAVGFRVPMVIIQAVEDAAKFALMDVERVTQAAALGGGPDLPRVEM